MSIKKILFLLSIICLVPLYKQFTAKAISISPNLRIGLESQYEQATAIHIKNRTISVGYEVNGVYQEGATIEAYENFSVAPANLHYVHTGLHFTNYWEAADYATQWSTIGYPSTPAFLALNDWTVYLGGFSNVNEASNAASETGGHYIPLDAKRFVLLDGANARILLDHPQYNPQIVDPTQNFISLDDRSYRGVIEFNRTLDNHIFAINVLSMDEYLLSVVPSEMPSSWPMEALKAQAVSARSYTTTQSNAHISQGYHLCDKVHCQSYVGVVNESSQTTMAVMETSGFMAYYANQPINAVYFSSSGGVTENSENVWLEAAPYLRSVSDTDETEYKEWSRTFSLNDITNLLTANHLDIGAAVSLSINLSDSGRVQQLHITGSSGDFTLTKEDIRTFFSPSLESRYFTISNGSFSSASSNSHTVSVQNSEGIKELPLKSLNVLSANGVHSLPADTYAISSSTTAALQNTLVTISSTGDSIVFSGKGWGHGVGMSQFGAKGMAENGYTYDQIIKYYYTGVEIK